MKINKISNRITIKVIARNELNQKVPITVIKILIYLV